MASEEETLQKVILTRLLRLNAIVQGLVTGLIAGLAIFAATNWLLITAAEGEIVGPHLSLLGQFFVGYDVSLRGSLIGLAYGFSAGFSIGYLATVIYNHIVARKERSLIPRPSVH
jgi:hypothetical protein